MPVRSDMRGNGVPLLPRTLGVALVVGLVAFLAGMQLGPSHGGAPTASPQSPTPVPSATLATPLPDRSGFAAAFDAYTILRDAGLRCGGEGNGRSGGGDAYSIFQGSCPVLAADQPRIIGQIEAGISMAIRGRAMSLGGGFSGPLDTGTTVMGWDYASDGFEGSIHLVATGTPSTLEVVIILTERLAP